MAAYAFNIGMKLSIRGVRYAIANKLEDGRLQFRQPETSELVTLSCQDLLALYASNEAEFEYLGVPTSGGAAWHEEFGDVAFASLPDEIREPAERRERYAKAVLNAGVKHLNKGMLDPIIRECATDRAYLDPKPPGWLSIYRWVKRYVKSGRDIRSLLDQRASQGNHTLRKNGRIRELAIQALDEAYLILQHPKLNEPESCLQHLIDLENKQRPPSQQLGYPSRKYLSKVLHQEFDEYTITERRYGKLAAERDFRGAIGQQERPTRPMERVELDHTVLDMIAVDDVTFILLGRPIIAFAIDKLTRCIVGFSLGFQHPSASTVAACVKHAILPKSYMKSLYPNIKNNWECMGNIETLVLDRALENLGRRVASAGRQNGMDIEYNKRRSGWGKGTVERLIRTVNEGLIHLMPGTTFSNVLARGDYQPAKHAIITKSALLAILHKWIVDVYHQSLHRGIHDTPAHKWQTEAAGCPVYLPRSARDLEIAFGMPERQTLWHYGIEVNRLKYNNDLMLELRRKIGNEQDVDFMWYEEDMGYIDVLDPTTKTYIRVHCTDFEYANGLTLYQHDVNRDYAKANFEGRVDVSALAAAKAEIRDMISECFSKNNGTTHKRQARYMDGRGFEYPQDTPPVSDPKSKGQAAHKNGTSDSQPSSVGVADKLSSRADKKRRKVSKDETVEYVQYKVIH